MNVKIGFQHYNRCLFLVMILAGFQSCIISSKVTDETPSTPQTKLPSNAPPIRVTGTSGKLCIGPLKLKVVHPLIHFLVIDGGVDTAIPANSSASVTIPDLNSDHEIRVIYDGHEVWKNSFNFESRRTTVMHLWRSAGYWHLDPVNVADCAELK